ncbi:MAG: hypothetical protein LBJ12_08200 [Oscillospiraceae bacterium]|nr:hypothetical protein [Oscillospiraceae bacterium]
MNFCYNSPKLKEILGEDFYVVDGGGTSGSIPYEEREELTRSLFDIGGLLDDFVHPKNTALERADYMFDFAGGNIPQGEFQNWEFKCTYWSLTGWHIDEYYYDPVYTQYLKESHAIQDEWQRQLNEKYVFDVNRVPKKGKDKYLMREYAAANATESQMNLRDPYSFVLNTAYENPEFTEKYGENFYILGYRSSDETNNHWSLGKVIDALLIPDKVTDTWNMFLYIADRNKPPAEGDEWRFHITFDYTSGWRVDSWEIDNSGRKEHWADQSLDYWYDLNDLATLPYPDYPPKPDVEAEDYTEGYTIYTTP